MLRRLITAALVVGSAGYVWAAAERATFILTDGERKSGPVVFHTESRENLINGMLNLGADNGKEQTFPIDQVAVIDFVGGTPSAAELSAIPASGQMLARRDGGTELGHFINMIGGDTVRWADQGGASHDIPIAQVSRIYLNPQSARTAFNAPAPADAVGTSGQLGPGEVRVLANRPWNDTGVDVRKGDRIVFHTTGQITFGPEAGMTAGPDGNDRWRRATYPVAAVPVGALIFKVANSAPSPIGSNAQPIVMPADGRLMLGVNDDEFGDNSGSFTVLVTRAR